MTATTETTGITVVSGPTSPGTASDWELFFARRALATLKARLGLEGLLDLLQPDLAASAKNPDRMRRQIRRTMAPRPHQTARRGPERRRVPLLLPLHLRRLAQAGRRTPRALRPGSHRRRASGRREPRTVHHRFPHHVHQRRPQPSVNSRPTTPSAWQAPPRSPTAPSSDTPCTNSVKPAPGSTRSWSSTSRQPRRKPSSKDTASTWPWNSPTGSPQLAYHSAGPATHPNHSS